MLEILRLATSENKLLYSEILRPEFGYERILETDLKVNLKINLTRQVLKNYKFVIGITDSTRGK